MLAGMSTTHCVGECESECSTGSEPTAPRGCRRSPPLPASQLGQWRLQLLVQKQLLCQLKVGAGRKDGAGRQTQPSFLEEGSKQRTALRSGASSAYGAWGMRRCGADGPEEARALCLPQHSTATRSKQAHPTLGPCKQLPPASVEAERACDARTSGTATQALAGPPGGVVGRLILTIKLAVTYLTRNHGLHLRPGELEPAASSSRLPSAAPARPAQPADSWGCQVRCDAACGGAAVSAAAAAATAACCRRASPILPSLSTPQAAGSRGACAAAALAHGSGGSGC